MAHLQYQFTEVLQQTQHTTIYRGYCQCDRHPVVIKLLRADGSSPPEIARIKHEHEILQGKNIPGIITPLELVHHERGLALVLEGFVGQSLQEFARSRSVDLETFFAIAIQLTDTLGRLHRQNIIHKDIKPANIIIDPETLETRITDFSIAAILPDTRVNLPPNQHLEGTLAYMSPEQTGRIDRAIDYRTDFYALGITFYELLAGRLPFNASEPMEWVHAHLAKSATPLCQLCPSIPPIVSDIIDKLIAKRPEARYQSAYGLKADLNSCAQQWRDRHQIEPFPLARHDRSVELRLPDKLYGREAEIQSLSIALDRASRGTTELVLVRGYSGIGKSALVGELHAPTTRRGGYFIDGKFDRFGQDIPYSAFVRAFQDLVRQLLAEPQHQLEVWQAQLQAALGANGQVIVDAIPELALIIGEQPPVPSLSPAETQNRFNLVFAQFVRVFARPECPLVIFIDDLQWADMASLKLWQLLAVEADIPHLLLVGAYRDNEVNRVHPLSLTLAAIEERGQVVRDIPVGNLQLAHVEQMLVEALDNPPGFEALAELLHAKTQGNPFYLNQLLQSLYHQKLLGFDLATGQWQWDLQHIQAVGISDLGIVELMVRRLRELPEQTQDILKFAACIGTLFDLDLLSVICEKPLGETAVDLDYAIAEGLILPASETYGSPQPDRCPSVRRYRFLHDRVQQAAYSLIPETKRPHTHLHVGRLLKQNRDRLHSDGQIFEIVNQFLDTVDLVTDEAERYELVRLNSIAIRKAKAAIAYETALRYLTVALQLLPDGSWDRDYDLTLNLYLEGVEIEYYNDRLERAQSLSQQVVERAKDDLDRLKVYEIEVQYSISKNQMGASIDVAWEALSLLGLSLPQDPDGLAEACDRLQQSLSPWRGERIDELQHLPRMADPYQYAALRILVTVTPPVFIGRPHLFPVVALSMVDLCVRGGNSEFAAFAYTEYSLLFVGTGGDVESGYRFGRLALDLLERYPTRELKGQVYLVFNFFVRHWKEPLRATLDPLLESMHASLEVGDVEYACYAASFYCSYLALSGEPLESARQQISECLDSIHKFQREFQYFYAKIWEQFAIRLQAEAGADGRLNDGKFDENRIEEFLVQSNNHMSLFSLYLAQTILAYVMGDYGRATSCAKRGMAYETVLVGMRHVAQTNCYYSLSLLGQYDTGAAEIPTDVLSILGTNQVKLKHWAKHSPENYQHEFELVEAEKARVLGKYLEAMELYDRAIANARQNNVIYEEAIAYERAGTFYEDLGRLEIAQTYLKKAHFCYCCWGATAKAKALETRYPQCLSKNVVTEKSLSLSTGSISSTTGSHANTLDLTSALEASQALSEEIVLGNLLSKLMHIAIENAGAQRGYFIAYRNDGWAIEAKSSIENDRETVEVLKSIPLDRDRNLAMAAVNYVRRTGQYLVIDDATKDELVATDPYAIASGLRSILCLPIFYRSQITGILYLENYSIAGAFTSDRVETLRVLTSQIAISIENARLYEGEREKSKQLENSLRQLQQTQAQLVQAEKISSLGQLVASVSHEVNNPLGFISANLDQAQDYVSDLLELIQLYHQYYPDPVEAIGEKAEDIDLDFIIEDFPPMIDTMKMGAKRIQEIISSLRTFSRKDKKQKEAANLHEGIDSTLLILRHRLKAKPERPEIEIVKEYGDLPPVSCHSGQLNQVFMNLIANAIDAFDDINQDRAYAEIESNPNRIRIKTEIIGDREVAIRISDNGPGIPEKARQEIFEPFFTTKPAGKGTGLGLHICHQIVVDQHGGELACNSNPGEGTEFVIRIPV